MISSNLLTRERDPILAQMLQGKNSGILHGIETISGYITQSLYTREIHPDVVTAKPPQKTTRGITTTETHQFIYQELKKINRIISPNPSFFDQLSFDKETGVMSRTQSGNMVSKA